MFCHYCGKKNKDGASYCAYCGRPMIEQDGGSQEKAVGNVPLTRKEKRAAAKAAKKVQKREKKAHRKAEKKAQKKAKWAAKSFGQKVGSILQKFLLWLLLLAVLAAGTIGLLTYFDIVKIPVANSLLVSIGLKEESLFADYDENMQNEYEVTPPDAESYFENNATVILEIDVNDSDTVLTEAETCDILADRGFTQFPITTEYSMAGEYYEAMDISDTSSSKHPIYQTYYVTETGDVWTIFVINGVIMANPVSYNLQSGLDVQVIISETNTVTSYDSTTNKFYETIPLDSALIVKTITKIDAETLEALTYGAIDRL